MAGIGGVSPPKQPNGKEKGTDPPTHTHTNTHLEGGHGAGKRVVAKQPLLSQELAGAAVVGRQEEAVVDGVGEVLRPKAKNEPLQKAAAAGAR